MKTSRALWIFALVLAVAAIAPQAHATDVTATCTAPTKNTDGSTITGAITYKFYGALQGQTKTLLNSTPRTTCANTWASAPVGTVCVAATAVVAGVESAQTPESCTVVAAPVPQPPGALTVTIATAYEIRPNSTGTLVATRIGVIQLGTQCQSDTRKVGAVTYNRVDPKSIDLINWPAVVPPVDTFAKCG